jgi:hypothetical protein
MAENLPDPTRPPALLLEPAGEAAPAEPGGGLVLQSVLIAPDRRAAVIGGRAVPLGAKVGAFTLSAVRETEVTLTGPEGSRTLRLFPGVDKRAVRVADETATPVKTPSRKVAPR